MAGLSLITSRTTGITIIHIRKAIIPKAELQPKLGINQVPIRGAKIIPPTPIPVVATPKAVPLRSVNQLEMSVLMGTRPRVARPTPTTLEQPKTVIGAIDVRRAREPTSTATLC